MACLLPLQPWLVSALSKGSNMVTADADIHGPLVFTFYFWIYEPTGPVGDAWVGGGHDISQSTGISLFQMVELGRIILMVPKLERGRRLER